MRLRFARLLARLVRRLREVDLSAVVRSAGAPAIVLAVIAASLALICVPPWQVGRLPNEVRKDQAKVLELENEARRTLTQIVGGAFGLIALFLGWRRVRAGDQNVRILEQGHITDRFTKAIEQLGAFEEKEPNIEVRLGGIYALERIAFDSPRDHWTIMEVLTAYVRRNAPWTGPYSGQPDPNVKPRTDIQAILTVLGRRRRDGQREKDQLLDLSITDLRGADLREIHLEGANLFEAHLEGANLVEAHLEGANIEEAHLEGTLGLTPDQVRSGMTGRKPTSTPNFGSSLDFPPRRTMPVRPRAQGLSRPRRSCLPG